MRLTSMIAGILACLGVAACGGSSGYGTTAPGPNTIAATSSLTFTPASLTVSPGTTVTFSFGSVGHNVFFNTIAGAPADIPGTNANTTVTRTFSTAGTYVYTCHIHAGMSGTVVVQ